MLQCGVGRSRRTRPSSEKILLRCHSTVRIERYSWALTSALVWPWLANRGVGLLHGERGHRIDALARLLAGGGQLTPGPARSVASKPIESSIFCAVHLRPGVGTAAANTDAEAGLRVSPSPAPSLTRRIPHTAAACWLGGLRR